MIGVFSVTLVFFGLPLQHNSISTKKNAIVNINNFEQSVKEKEYFFDF